MLLLCQTVTNFSIEGVSLNWRFQFWIVDTYLEVSFSLSLELLVSQFTIDPFTSMVSNTWAAGSMWPARGSNAAREHQEKLRFHKKYWFYWSISQKDSVLTPFFFLILIMRPARLCFQAHVARETLWVWDPWCTSSSQFLKNCIGWHF